MNSYEEKLTSLADAGHEAIRGLYREIEALQADRKALAEGLEALTADRKALAEGHDALHRDLTASRELANERGREITRLARDNWELRKVRNEVEHLSRKLKSEAAYWEKGVKAARDLRPSSPAAEAADAAYRDRCSLRAFTLMSVAEELDQI